ncbi:D-alanyl-D-alanine carboxypeptidase [Candidatus Saccharibacteria bacterium]|nr:D-alanyl-D-alanine carboxypeptidase [Candidatus Saccharibacteria bacterium]
MSFKVLLVLMLTALLGWSGYAYSRPLPEIKATAKVISLKTSQAINLPWPAYGQGALGALGYGVLETHGQQKAVPMASLAKVITALAVLKQKPLALGQTGPTITINSDDVAIYNSYYNQGGSVVKVEVGEQLSQYQALQALLIPSANNMADTLARWAFGSMDSYISFANQMLQGLSLQNTKVADASGFSPESVSSAQDLVKLGLSAMQNPLIASLVKQEVAELPVAGKVNNVNWLLGSDGVVGIKTGNTDEAGGCFLFASQRNVGGQSLTLIGALMQAPDRNTAIRDARILIQASDSGFETVKAVSQGQTVATYEAPWGAKSEVVAKDDSAMLAWRGASLQTSAQLNNLTGSYPVRANTSVGSIKVANGQKTARVSVILKNNLVGPPWHWRIFR